MPGIKSGYLASIDLFRDLDPPLMQAAERSSMMSLCEPGRIFYRPGETDEVLFLLKKGRVQLYRISPAGKKLVVVVLGPGAAFGEMALVGQGLHDAFAEALEDCTLCCMSREDVERLIAAEPRIALGLIEALGERLREAESRLEDLAFRSVPARLAGLLLRLAEARGGGHAVTGYSHRALAEMLGTYRETVTQALDEFKADGLVRIGRRRIELLRPDALREIAGP